MTYKERKYTYIFAIYSALLLPGTALADIVMPKNIFYIDQVGKNASTAFKTSTVQNINDSRTFNIMSRVYKVTKNSGQQNEIRVPTSDVTVFPPFFTLEPNAKQQIRIILKTSEITDDTESVYRVQLIPQAPTATDQKLDVITTMGALVFVKPTEIIGDIAWRRTDDTLVIKNKSNANVVLRNSKNCKATFSCIANAVRLWPGNSWKVKTPASLIDKTIALEKSTYGVSQEVRISR